MTRYVVAGAILAGLLSGREVRAQRPSPTSVPTPAKVLGFAPGTDRKLPQWTQVVEYFTQLGRSSPRIQVHTLGKTTLGRPFIAAFISDSATIANLPTYREIQRRLADPRLLPATPAERRDSLIANGKTVVLITSSIHSVEVGGILTPLLLAYRLVTGEDEESRAIRANTITILVPSLNPDGVDIVGNWYRSTLGTPYEGSEPPELWHHYTGHDNNRDWYAFTQVETRLTIDSLHSVWHPQIVNDIHQQEEDGSRIFIPPYMDPIEPNIDPIVSAGVDAMGTAMIWRLTAEGKTGIATNASYDAWTPARAYMHYHGGIRILTETASAHLASPIDVPFDSLHLSRGYDPRVATWNFLAPWPGGRWTIANILDYQTSASWALLVESARLRRSWLTSFAAIGERAVLGKKGPGRASWPTGFVIPSENQPDPAALATMIRILQRGQVEVRQTKAPLASDGSRNATGAYVVLLDQPYGGFAKALLENQHYPDLREYPGGPPKAPYDVTAHTLPLLMGVRVSAIDTLTVPTTSPIPMLPEPALSVAGLSGSSTRRIAIYRSYAPSMDEGWTRWVLDQYDIHYTSIVNRDVLAGKLHDRFDVIVIPDQSPRTLRDGAFYEHYPDSLTGGLGRDGPTKLAEFVEAGGTLVTFNDASRWAITSLGLPVKDVLDGVSVRDFYGPGSILRIELKQDDPLTKLMVAPPVAWFEHGPAFEITDPSRATAVATYPAEGSPLLSGWLLGGERLRGKAALVDVKQGKGHVVLFGFRPQYRGQSIATYPLVWAALLGR